MGRQAVLGGKGGLRVLDNVGMLCPEGRRCSMRGRELGKEVIEEAD